MRESVHLCATRDRQPRCYLRVRRGRRMLTRSEAGEWGYARPNICDPMAHWIGATARAAKGVQNLRSSKLPRYACRKVRLAPRYRRPAAVAGLWARGSTLDFDTAHPRRGSRSASSFTSFPPGSSPPRPSAFSLGPVFSCSHIMRRKRPLVRIAATTAPKSNRRAPVFSNTSRMMTREPW